MTKAIESKLATADAREDDEGKLAYLKMPSTKYYILTIGLYLACTTASIIVSDIAVVFEFAGAFGLSLTSFTMPGMMYLIVIKNPQVKAGVESEK